MSTLYIVATPIGNLKDITFRAIEILNQVRYIAAEDTRHTRILLDHYQIKSELFSYHKFNEASQSEHLVEMMINGNCDMALVTDAGTPCISDPGYRLVDLAVKNNINVIGIPGASAVITALSVSGFKLNNYCFLGFFPRQAQQQKTFIDLIKDSEIETFVFYESPQRVISSLKYLGHNGAAEFNATICNDLTKKFEKIYRGTVETLINALESNKDAKKGEYVIAIEKKIQPKRIINDINKDKVCIEALLVKAMIENKLSLKEAISMVKDEQQISKNDIYQASINLKDLFIK